MTKAWWGKFCLLVLSVVFSVLYVYPTIANLDPETSKFPVKQKMNMGLDLQGGVYLVLGVDFNRVYKEVVARQGTALIEHFKEKGITINSVTPLTEGATAEDPMLEAKFDPARTEAVKEILKKDYATLRLVDDKPGVTRLGIARDYKNDIREKTLAQSIEVIRNRIDEFGVSEPSITSQGTDRVVVELPGVKDVDRAKDLIGKTARLEFKIVNDGALSEGQLAGMIQKAEEENKINYVEGKTAFSDYAKKINDVLKAKIPPGSEIAFERVKVSQNPEAATQRIPYLLFSKADVTGDDLQDAGVSLNPERNTPEVTLTFNPRGTVGFDKLTGEHTGKRLAIVLDNIVHSAPVLQTRISNGRAVITLGRGNHDQMMQEAKDISTVLRAGALPTQLDFLEQRVVGPSLGQDSIHKGSTAALIGAALVFLFVLFYYKKSGVIAVITLLLNVLFVLACLVGLEATLTLPGIAGIALTIGIAVDSNVVIYERIREELRHGKAVSAAIESGFQKAFRTIVDANVTNAIASIVLLVYGTGPIKGFAVTMLIGIVTTLFTAVFACKVLFDWYMHRLERNGVRTLSI
ncbi:MAG: protein translocase subunit SecD [Cryobacterium sp.]|nr:protein translocase subunit SecD [Oligoflexia bacterium]